MCGITGVFHFSNERKVNPDLLKKMANTLKHRGPDGEGFYIKNNIGLGHRRLAIIDITTGNQPIFNEDKTIVIVFNGEIYNYIELRSELVQLRHKFITTSDTEVIVHAYEQWGFDCLQKFNGCWAFALWDENLQQLFIARDRLGEKPLFYSKLGHTLVFGSEIKSLFAYGINPKFNLEFIQLYLTLSYIPSPFTFYENINKLEPGHFLLVKDGTIVNKKYWDLPFIDENNMLSNKNEIYEEFKYLLTDSTKIRMRSDVSYGAFLSGGLDSSSIVSIMAELSSRPIETFTIGFNEMEFDESYLAQKVAAKFRTNHNKAIIDSKVFDKCLNEISFYFDEPFGDSSAIPTSYVSNYAARKVKMVLTGDGGDEALSGYATYQILDLLQTYKNIPFSLRRLIPILLETISPIFNGTNRLLLNRAIKILLSNELDFTQKIVRKASWIPFDIDETLFDNCKNQYSPIEFFTDFFKSCPYKNEFYKYMYFNLKLSLPDDMLTKVDRMSMAHSLEARVPFLDHRIIEFLAKVDKKIKIQRFERKSILRKTIGKDLPPELLKVGKRGFESPMREWLKESSFNERIKKLSRLEQIGLNSKLISVIFENNQKGIQDSGYFLWMLFVLDRIIFTER